MEFDSYIVSETKIANTLPLVCPPPYSGKGFGLKSKAFTLAETLITLTIIGIIAAMTIPTLLAKYQDHVTVTKLKKMQSVLANAVSMQRAKGDSLDDYGSGYFAIRTIKENLKGTDCSYTSTNRSSSCNAFGTISVDDYGKMLLDDGIAVGTHLPYGPQRICVAFDKKGKKYDGTPVYFCDNPFSYCFYITDNYTLIPFGVPDGEYPLTREATCPAAPIVDDYTTNGCTYWTLRTGKVTKKAGEWFDD